MFFSGPKSYKIKKIEQFRGTKNKKMFYLHFDSDFVSCSYEGEFRGHFVFFHSNLLVSNFYFWSTMLTQINHTIVNIFSGTLIVTVNIRKNDRNLVFKGLIKDISFQRH